MVYSLKKGFFDVNKLENNFILKMILGKDEKESFFNLILTYHKNKCKVVWLVEWENNNELLAICKNIFF